MVAEAEDELPLSRRCIAAAGAAVVAATIVNPFDVVKTRMQAQAIASTSRPEPNCYISTLYEQHRHLLFTREAVCAAAQQRRALHLPHQLPMPAQGAGGCSGGAAAPGAAPPLALPRATLTRSSDAGAWYHPQPYRKWGICEAPLCVRKTPPLAAAGAAAHIQGAAAAAAAGAAPLQLPASQQLARVPYLSSSSSMWSTFRMIVQTEGLPVMWRGTATSLLIAVPMVGIYMPLYDTLLSRWERAGAAAPVVAGVSARTVAVFCVAPFELARTRLQAAAPGAATRARDVLRPYWDASSAGGALRSLPRLWTGFGATLLRDVPFSALYWALLEPLRRQLLPPDRHLQLPTLVQGRPQALEAGEAGGGGGSGGGGLRRLLQGSDGGGGGAAVGSGWQARHVQHTQQEVVAANMVAGFVAGGAAASVTTPFDVLKTRRQVAAAAGGGAREASASAVAALRQIARSEGVRGLFRGVVPRAARAAPACAIVISVYESLKASLLLTPR